MKKVIVYTVAALAMIFWASCSDNENMENIHGNLGLLLLVMAFAEAL